MPDPSWGTIAELGSTATLLGVVVWVAKAFVPTLLATMKDLREADIKQVGALKSLAAVNEKQIESLRSINRTQRKILVSLIYHDATVRGTNPDTVGSTEELLRKVNEINGGE